MNKMFNKVYNFIRSLFDDKWGVRLQQNFPFKYKGLTYWYSRSCAVASFIYCRNKKGQLFVLANKRGKGTPNFQGYWNCPCGYLDWNESASHAASRELYEECGIAIQPNALKLMGIETDPRASGQNVTIRFAYEITDKTVEDFSFDLSHMEENEVEEVAWIKLGDHLSLDWAFGHKSRILQVWVALENKEYITKF